MDSETDMETEEPSETEADSEDPAVNEDVENEEPENEMEPEPNTNTAEAEVDTEEAEDEADPENEEPTTNESRCQEYLALVEFADSHGGPEWALNQLQTVLEATTEQRKALIKSLAANEACAFSAEDLSEWDNDALNKLRQTLEAPIANYAGQPKPAKPEPTQEGRTRIDLPPL